MSIFVTLVICSWSKPYLELSDFPENWYGKSLQHILDAKKVLAAASAAGAAVTAKIDFCCYGGVGGGCGGLTTAKTFFASRICCKDLPYQFSGESDNYKYGLLQLQITSVSNILILSPPLWKKTYTKKLSNTALTSGQKVDRKVMKAKPIHIGWEKC